MTRVSMPPLGAAAPARTSLAWDAGSDAYVFQSEAARYRVVVGPGDEQSSILRIEGCLPGFEWQPLLRTAGILVREAEGAVLPPSADYI